MIKKEGNIDNCGQCGEELICKSVEYQGKTTLQWQNNDGTAHYKFISRGKYECRTPDGLSTTVSESISDVNPVAPNIHYHSKTKAEEQKLETSRLREKLEELVSSGQLSGNTPQDNAMLLYVQTLELCDKMEITDEIKRGMMINNTTRIYCSQK